MVLQETWLKSGTIAENIAYGRPDADREEIITAAKACHAHSFIKRMPDGYDTVIGEDGGTLSQGQKQRLAIARALYSEPDILVLDEATSALDMDTEKEICSVLDELKGKTTIIVIAHRLSTIEKADKVIKIDKSTGRIY